MAVNLVGTFDCLRLAADAMARNGPNAEGERGIGVDTASVAAFDEQIGRAAYAASKGGVAALTLPAARELARHGIRVMCIASGIFETPMLSAMPKRCGARGGYTVVGRGGDQPVPRFEPFTGTDRVDLFYRSVAGDRWKTFGPFGTR